MVENRPKGRPRSIPQRLFVRVFRLKRAGFGYQRIATDLNRLGVATSRGSVERLVKGLSPYDDYERSRRYLVDGGAPPRMASSVIGQQRQS